MSVNIDNSPENEGVSHKAGQSVLECCPQVTIVPLVTVNIQEMLSHDSDEQEQAAVSIRPRHPVTQEKLVSLVLDFTLQKPMIDASPVYHSPNPSPLSTICKDKKARLRVPKMFCINHEATVFLTG